MYVRCVDSMVKELRELCNFFREGLKELCEEIFIMLFKKLLASYSSSFYVIETEVVMGNCWSRG